MIYLKIDINIFSVIVLILAYINFSKNQKDKNNYLNFLKTTFLCIINILIIDIFVNILLNNLTNNVFINIAKLFLTFNSILTILASWSWTLFLIYYLNPNNKYTKIFAFITAIPFVINLILSIWNLIIPVYFTITLENGYQRFDFFFIFSLCALFYMIFSIFIVIKEHKNLSFSKLWILLSFEILPSLGGFIQILFYGTLFTYPFAALSLLLIYVYLNEDISIIDSVSKAYSNKYLTKFFNNNILGLNKIDYSLCYIDIDDLGKINNKFGEKEGDFVLQEFIKIVNDCIEVPDFIASCGGDEFVIYFDNNDEKQILNNLKVISRNIQYFNKISNKPYNINFTFVYYINKSNKNSPFKILKTLYYKLAIKKEKILFTQNYNSYMKEKNNVLS